MYREILIPTDGSELATKAIRHGVILAKTVGARVTFLTVYEPYRILTINPAMIEYTPEEYTKYARQEAEKILAEGAIVRRKPAFPAKQCRWSMSISIRQSSTMPPLTAAI